MARLKDRYNEEIAPALKERFGIENPMRIPRLEKIVVNMGVGEASQNGRALDGAMEDLGTITGQKAQMRRARKSIAGFNGHGNYALGLREQLIFPEISYDAIDATRGLDVAVVTTTESDEEARELLRLLGMPFRDS
jgi:large subunit ribosomal protein L5